jgi:hypothetical protein
MKALLVATVLAVILMPSALAMANGKNPGPSNAPTVLIYNPSSDGL